MSSCWSVFCTVIPFSSEAATAGGLFLQRLDTKTANVDLVCGVTSIMQVAGRAGLSLSVSSSDLGIELNALIITRLAA